MILHSAHATGPPMPEFQTKPMLYAQHAPRQGRKDGGRP